MLVRLIAFLLIAETASATGLWLDGQEQIASSASVVTNAGTTSFTNDFSSNPTNGLSGWVFRTSTTANVFWDSGSNAVAFHWLSGASGTPWFGFTSDTARANGVYTMNWQTIAIADSGGRSDFLELMTDGSTNARVNLGLETRGLGQQTQIITGEWNCIRFLNEGGGGGNVKMWIDNVFLNDTNVVYYITTNSGSGTSGPTFDGIIPLSTNRHLWTDGRPAP